MGVVSARPCQPIALEKDVRGFFKDIKDRTPLTRLKVSRKLPRAQVFEVRGMTRLKQAWEWRAIFFRNSKAEATYPVTIMASFGMLELFPDEPAAILEGTELVRPKTGR